MSKRIIAQDEEIVIGVDVSDRTHHLAVVNMRGEILKDAAIKAPACEAWEMFLASRLPGCRVRVIYEAGPQGYTLYDAVRKMGHAAVVVAPVKALGIKTNRRDARTIAHDYLAGRYKAVTVPTFEKRIHRQVLRQRNQIQKEIKRTSNRINAMKRFHGITGSMVSSRKDGSGYLDFCIRRQSGILDFLRAQRAELDAALSVIALESEYRADVEKLTRITGIGTLSALEIVLDVADVRTFGSAEKFASYTGLCPGEWSTGEKRRMGHITRRGPGKLRGTLVQCAWTAVRYDPEEKKRFQQLSARIGKKKAIVAIARRLAERAWCALNPREEEKAA